MKRVLVITAGALLVAASATAVPGAAMASAYPAGPITDASGTSPFAAGCGMTAAGGSVTLNSEVEPSVDVSPVDSDIVVGMWQQDRWSNGGARGNVAGVSFDAGATWDLLTFPGVTECSGGEFDRASDPWVSFAPNGDLHLMHLVLDIEPPPGRPGGFGANGMMVQKVPAAAFADGAVTEAEVTDPALIAFADNGDLHDKNTLTADPTDSRFVYAVWDKLDVPTGAYLRPDRSSALGFTGAALISRSADGGRTWSEPETLYNPGAVNQTIGNQIVVDDEGVVYDFFNEITNFRNDDGETQFDFNLSMKYSLDKGGTWLPNGRPIRIDKIRSGPVSIPAGDENAGQPVRTGDIIPDVAADPRNGNLYAVWMDTRFSGGDHNDIAFVMSTDGGRTWSRPIQVNKTPPGLSGDAAHAFTAAVHVAADGTVGVSYYDFRRNAPGGGTDTDFWLVHCHAECASAPSWGDETRLGGSFDTQQAPFAGGYFLGDYTGLSNAGEAFAALFSRTTATDPANAAFATVAP